MRIGVITSSRADFDILLPLLREFKKHREVELLLFVTGMHLMPEFGLTMKYIETEGFKIDHLVDLEMASTTREAVVDSIAAGLNQFARLYQQDRPDAILILGDRAELLGATIPAVILNVPIIHLSGGDITEGAYDDTVRHCLTKMASLHFPTTEVYRQRVIQMGENPSTVFNFGSLGIDRIVDQRLLSRDELGKELGVNLEANYFLVTYHPETKSTETLRDFQTTLKVLSRFVDNYKILFTYPNSDPQGLEFIEEIKKFETQHKGQVKSFQNLGSLKYHSAAQHAIAVVGNSSSGVTEIPTLKIPSINIGDRQKGRLAAESVIHCRANESDIEAAIHRALSPDFRKSISTVKNPYGNGDAAAKISRQILQTRWENLRIKKFFDMPLPGVL